MRRRIFAFTAVVSLALLVGAVALWVRSYFASEGLNHWTRQFVEKDGLHAGTRTTAIAISWSRGALIATRFHTEDAAFVLAKEGWQYRRWDPRTPLAPPASPHDRVNLSAAGFHLVGRVETTRGGWESQVYMHVPFWSVCLALSVVPSLWLWLWLRGRRGPPHNPPMQPTGGEGML